MKTATRTTGTTRFPPLTLADRGCCCSARAAVRVVLPEGQDLLMCAHHFRRHEGRLQVLGAIFADETGALPPTPVGA